ncbi:MAG: NADH-quinone oxidoreductase subunit H [Bacteroidia bacterium]|nr:NADH-quinone oxidoreductase subunit H [Bacteroidia bacterium]MCX7651467.1 NADH-quinone oxidoreductase subunit H [Bacteroidia bacterium]MDW8416778.1 complex I subunit 1 family protein [Bacteroidia bacterium]
MDSVLVIGGTLLYGLLAVYVERKLAAWIQDRQGPMETGIYGLGQPIADILKLLRKTENLPATAVKQTFLFAPALALLAVVGTLAFVPLTKTHADHDYALWLAVSILSIEAVAVFLGGWSSGSKYALLGAYRLLVSLLAYELILGLLLLTVITHYKTLSFATIVTHQHHLWGIFQSPFMTIAGIVWFSTGVMIAHRAPFDLPETESELVAGTLTEYSGFRFALFMLAEYILMLLQAFWIAYVFLGGTLWVSVPGLVLLQMILRWAWPRWRPDQVLAMAWRKGIPLAFFTWIGEMMWIRMTKF